MKIAVALALVFGASFGCWADEFPNFAGRTLEDKPVARNLLTGKPTVVVITPNRKASEQTREWLRDLRSELSQKVQIRDLIEHNTPFFVSDKDLIRQAKKAIPKTYWKDTWLVTYGDVAGELGQPEKGSVIYVYVLDSEAQVIAQIEGAPSEAKISKIKATLQSATSVSP